MAELANESLESLQLKLADYQANLDGINLALLTEPDSEELSKLKSDLEEVISYFKDLVELKRGDGAALPEGGEVADLTIGPLAAGAALEQIDLSQDATATAAALGFDVPLTAGGAGAAALQVHPAPQALALIGRTCVMTKENQKLEFGTIQGLRQIDPTTGLPLTVQVYWYARGQTKQAPVQKLRLLSPMPPESIVPGMTAQALFSEDGQWYPCTIDAITQEGYTVTYSGYANQETVPADRLRPADTQVVGSGQSATAAQKKKQVKEIVTPGGYKIPANLLMKATDTQLQRQEKRRRLNQLKKEQKAQAEETEARDRQTGWRSHLTKTTKKPGNKVTAALLHDYAPKIIKDPAYLKNDK